MSGSPRTQYRLLAGIFLATALLALFLAAFPGNSKSLRGPDIATAVVLLVLAALALFVAPRVPGQWGVDALLLIVIAIGCVGAALVPTAEAQVIAGLGLSLFAVFAAYFRPPTRFTGLLVVIVVGYLIASLANPVTSSVAVAVAILVVIAVTSVMVSVQANRLRAVSLIDPLTGALNRRGMEQHLPVLVSSANRSRQALTVGLIDLDDFKSLNDRLGHAAGDEELIRVARTWRNGIRSGDLLVRYGGDEFALILLGATPQSARDLDMRMRQDDQLDAWSVGFANWEPPEDVYAALARADEEMFRDKRGWLNDPPRSSPSS